MKIKTLIEKEDGTTEFTAYLTPEQLKFLLEYAIQDILRKGLMLPIIDGEVVTIVQVNDNETPSNT